MGTAAERVDLDPERAWAGTVLAVLVALLVGVVAFPRLVYDRFVWQYFWGPVFADAHNVGQSGCAGRFADRVELYTTADACRAAAREGAVLARPGYTAVSEVGYMVLLLLALVGVFFLLDRLDVGDDRGLFFALVPFMVFGGAFRVLQDAGEIVVGYPANVLLISPIIYVSVFVITLAALLASIWLERRGTADEYTRSLATIGTGILAATLGYLLWLAFTTPEVGFRPQVTVVTLLLAAVAIGATWWLIGRYAPDINRGTERMGLVVLGGHAVDGAANVIALDWMPALGAGRNLVPKHPINEGIVAYTGMILPDSAVAVVGTAWPFLLVKMVAATIIVWIFDEEIFEESPRFAVLLLVAAVAVGLGPGTRDMIRATLGI